jgi:transcriptional regulator with XRE-family HTH domain
MERAAELGDFLRLVRARLTPEQVGLVGAGHRRTAGLRREEVAAVSGVGVTWYTRLEQGRAPSVSASVIDALARSLLLDDAEWSHLRSLAGLPAPQARDRPGSDPSVQRLLDALDPSPALAMDHLWNVVGWNEAHRRVLVDLGPVPTEERNLLRLVFTHPGVRSLMADWDTEAPTLVAEYRADLTPSGDDPEHLALVDDLCRRDPDFRRWWAEHRVATFRPRRRLFRKADGATFELEHHRLQLVGAPTFRLIAYLPPAPVGGGGPP